MKRASVTAAAFVLAIVLTPCESYAQRDLPLHKAVKAENLSAVKTLIAGGADPNAKERGSGITPLHLALIDPRSDIPEIALELIEAGANPNAVARWRSDWKKPYIFVYPLRLALSNEVNPVVVMALLDAGADPKSSALNGDTTLHWAARLRNAPSDGSMAAVPELVKTLIAAGVDPNDRNKAAYTPLQVAAGRNPNPAVVKALIVGGADMEARGGKYGGTPLHWGIISKGHIRPSLCSPCGRAGDARDRGRGQAARNSPCGTTLCGAWKLATEAVLRDEIRAVNGQERPL